MVRVGAGVADELTTSSAIRTCPALAPVPFECEFRAVRLAAADAIRAAPAARTRRPVVRLP